MSPEIDGWEPASDVGLTASDESSGDPRSRRGPPGSPTLSSTWGRWVGVGGSATAGNYPLGPGTRYRSGLTRLGRQ